MRNRVLLTIAALIVGSSEYGGAAQAQDRSKRTEAEAVSQSPAPVRPVAQKAAGSGEAVDQVLQSHPADDTREQNERQLSLQLREARAAEDAVFWSRFSVLISGMAVIGLLITIAQGRAALSRAAEANRISRVGVNGQLRAYCGVEKVDVAVGAPDSGPVPGTRMVFVEAVIRNYGSTPAYLCRGSIACIARSPSRPEAGITYKRRIITSRTLAPGASERLHIPMLGPEELVGDEDFFILGFWRYRTFDQDRFVRFRRKRALEPRPVNAGNMEYVSRGNVAT